MAVRLYDGVCVILQILDKSVGNLKIFFKEGKFLVASERELL